MRLLIKVNKKKDTPYLGSQFLRISLSQISIDLSTKRAKSHFVP